MTAPADAFTAIPPFTAPPPGLPWPGATGASAAPPHAAAPSSPALPATPLDPMREQLIRVSAAQLDTALAPLVASGILGPEVVEHFHRCLARAFFRQIPDGAAPVTYPRTAKAIEILRSNGNLPAPIPDIIIRLGWPDSAPPAPESTPEAGYPPFQIADEDDALAFLALAPSAENLAVVYGQHAPTFVAQVLLDFSRLPALLEFTGNALQVLFEVRPSQRIAVARRALQLAHEKRLSSISGSLVIQSAADIDAHAKK